LEEDTEGAPNELAHAEIPQLDPYIDEKFQQLMERYCVQAVVLFAQSPGGVCIEAVSGLPDPSMARASCAPSKGGDFSLFHHHIMRPLPIVILDLTADDRTKDHPLVTGAPGLRWCAMVPLHYARGVHIGTLSIAGVEPRESFSLLESQFLITKVQGLVRHIKDRENASAAGLRTG